MNRQSLIISLLFSSICTLFVACNPNGESPTIDEEAPKITIHVPEENKIYQSGSMMRVIIDIEENLELHNYTVSLKPSDQNTVFVLDSGHSHTKLFTIDKEVELPFVSNKPYELIVEATDHDENKETKTVQFFIE